MSTITITRFSSRSPSSCSMDHSCSHRAVGRKFSQPVSSTAPRIHLHRPSSPIMGLLRASRIYLALLAFLLSSSSFSSSVISRQTTLGTSHADSASVLSYRTFHSNGSHLPPGFQMTLVNYRKGGQAFINLVTVIPVRGGVHNMPEEADEIAYHIGFQVDLTEQPTWILDKLWDGGYYSPTNNGGPASMGHGFSRLTQAQNMTNIGLKGGRHGQMMSIAVSKELRNLIADTTFTDSVEISTVTNASGLTGASGGSGEPRSNATISLMMLVSLPAGFTSMNRVSASDNTMARSLPISLSPFLSLLLLEFLLDFVLVLSFKVAFLYVAPSVRLVLGYESQELVGKGISDVCHPADLVPLTRDLKEGSVGGLSVSSTGDAGPSMASNLVPKSVDLLFHALPKSTNKDTSTQQGGSPSQSSSESSSRSPSSSATSSSDDASDTPPYVWLECRGRLHVEPGKGRKAIILSERA